MKTDELIRVLATGVDAAGFDPRATTRRFALAIAAGAVLALPLLVLIFGVNPRLALDAAVPMFWIKAGFVLALVAAGALAGARLARPGAALGRAGAALLVPPLLLWLLALFALGGAEPAERTALVLGRTWRACPWNIALLSVPAFVAVFAAMRGLAPTRLRLAGAGAGLLAGAVGASVYALHCPELAAPFIGVWYVLGMLVPAAVGALIGPRVLRW